MSIGEVLGQLRAEFPDVTISKIRFLEAEGLVEPAAHAVGLPQVLPRRRRAAALRPGGAARPLPAAAGHQGAPRRARPRARAAGACRASGRGCPRARAAATGCPAPRALGRDAAELRLTRAELLDGGRHRRRAARPSSRATGWSRRAAGGRRLRRRRAGRRADRRRAGRASASSRGTCGPFRTAADREVGLVEQVVAPLLRQRSPEARARAEEVARELAALSRAAARGAGRRPALARLGTDAADRAASLSAPACRRRRRRAVGVGWRRERARRRRRPGRDARPTSRSCCSRSRGGERYLPIWIGAVEATAIAFAQQGVVPAAAADPRPVPRRARGARPAAHRGAHHRAARRRLLRRAGLRQRAWRSAPGRPTRSRSRCAPARRSSAPRRCSTRPASRSRTSRRTRSRSSASSSTRSRRRTSAGPAAAVSRASTGGRDFDAPTRRVARSLTGCGRRPYRREQ